MYNNDNYDLMDNQDLIKFVEIRIMEDLKDLRTSPIINVLENNNFKVVNREQLLNEMTELLYRNFLEIHKLPIEFSKLKNNNLDETDTYYILNLLIRLGYKPNTNSLVYKSSNFDDIPTIKKGISSLCKKHKIPSNDSKLFINDLNLFLNKHEKTLYSFGGLFSKSTLLFSSYIESLFIQNIKGIIPINPDRSVPTNTLNYLLDMGKNDIIEFSYDKLDGTYETILGTFNKEVVVEQFIVKYGENFQKEIERNMFHLEVLDGSSRNLRLLIYNLNNGGEFIYLDTDRIYLDKRMFKEFILPIYDSKSSSWLDRVDNKLKVNFDGNKQQINSSKIQDNFKNEEYITYLNKVKNQLDNLGIDTSQLGDHIDSEKEKENVEVETIEQVSKGLVGSKIFIKILNKYNIHIRENKILDRSIYEYLIKNGDFVESFYDMGSKVFSFPTISKAIANNDDFLSLFEEHLDIQNTKIPTNILSDCRIKLDSVSSNLNLKPNLTTVLSDINALNILLHTFNNPKKTKIELEREIEKHCLELLQNEEKIKFKDILDNNVCIISSNKYNELSKSSNPKYRDLAILHIDDRDIQGIYTRNKELINHLYIYHNRKAIAEKLKNGEEVELNLSKYLNELDNEYNSEPTKIPVYMLNSSNNKDSFTVLDEKGIVKFNKDSHSIPTNTYLTAELKLHTNSNTSYNLLKNHLEGIQLLEDTGKFKEEQRIVKSLLEYVKNKNESNNSEEGIEQDSKQDEIEDRVRLHTYREVKKALSHIPQIIRYDVELYKQMLQYIEKYLEVDLGNMNEDDSLKLTGRYDKQLLLILQSNGVSYYVHPYFMVSDLGYKIFRDRTNTIDLGRRALTLDTDLRHKKHLIKLFRFVSKRRESMNTELKVSAPEKRRFKRLQLFGSPETLEKFNISTLQTRFIDAGKHSHLRIQFKTQNNKMSILLMTPTMMALGNGQIFHKLRSGETHYTGFSESMKILKEHISKESYAEIHKIALNSFDLRRKI